MRCSTVFLVRRSGFLCVARTLFDGLKTRMKPSFFFFISLKNNIYSRESVFCSGKEKVYGWLGVFFLALAETFNRSAFFTFPLPYVWITGNLEHQVEHRARLANLFRLFGTD